MRKLDGKSLNASRWCVLFVLLLFSFAEMARAQDATDAARPEGERPQTGAPRPDDAARLLMQLNLSPEQRATLIEIRRESVAEGQPLVRRLNQARRALDEAIYADNIDETVIEISTREMAAAQAAVLHMRAMTELRVRRVLTPEQLSLFRQLRRDAQIKQRLERRALRKDEDGRRRAKPRPLFDNNLNQRRPKP